MSMVTRCPSCATLFRVTAQHLQARHGQVRCGRCMTVFDGFAALATLPDQELPEPLTRLAPPPVDAEAGAALAAPRASAPSTEQMAAPPATPDGASAEAAPAAGGGVGAREAAVAAEAAPAPRSGGHTVAWSAGIAVLVLALAAQAIYAWRVDLVATIPALKPAVVQFCGLLGCGVPLPQRPKLITIEASDLQVQDPSRPGVIQLTATLRNQAGVEVGYPALDLVLTNTKEHTLARRVFMPEEYLEPRQRGAAGLAANAEVTVRLVLDTGDLGAAGFRLALLPAR